MDDRLNILDSPVFLKNDVDGHNTAPITVDRFPGEIMSGNKTKFVVCRDDVMDSFADTVCRLFKLDRFCLEDGFIRTTAKTVSGIGEDDFQELNALARNGYVEFSENPVIDGYIFQNEDNTLTELKTILGESFNKKDFLETGVLYLTLDEWAQCRMLRGLRFQSSIGAIYGIQPSIGYFLSKYYKNIELQVNGFNITVSGELHSDVFDCFSKHFGLRKRYYFLVFEFKDARLLQAEWEQILNLGVELPKPDGNKLVFVYDNNFLEYLHSSLPCEWLRLEQSIKAYFADNEFVSYFRTYYNYDFKLFDEHKGCLPFDEEDFWRSMYENFHGDDYKIMRSKQIISFNFETEDELNEKLGRLKKFPILKLNDHGKDNRFKFYVQLNNGLLELQENISREFPDILTELSASGNKLIFRKCYQSGDKPAAVEVLIDNLKTAIQSTAFHYVINDFFVEKFYCKYHPELERETETHRLNQLLKRKFFIEDKGFMYYIGRLFHVYYPNLIFIVEDTRIDEVMAHITTHDAKSRIYPDGK